MTDCPCLDAGPDHTSVVDTGPKPDLSSIWRLLIDALADPSVCQPRLEAQLNRDLSPSEGPLWIFPFPSLSLLFSADGWVVDLFVNEGPLWIYLKKAQWARFRVL
jgi:hypothetical protein